MDYLKLSKKIEEEIIENRRKLHESAEVGFETPKTLAFIEQKLKEYGLTVDKFYTHAEIGEMCRAYRLKSDKKPYDTKHKIITDLLPYNQWLYQNIGKIDLTTLPQISGNAFDTGDFIRSKIKWYLSKM